MKEREFGIEKPVGKKKERKRKKERKEMLFLSVVCIEIFPDVTHVYFKHFHIHTHKPISTDIFNSFMYH